jgi:CRISPR-associated endonuclease/helicase Cas3
LKVLSACAKSLWAKSPSKFVKTQWPEESWLPLYVHMSDAVAVAKLLWDRWVPIGTKKIISENLERGRKIFIFLAMVHDLGKATPAFQIKVEELGIRLEKYGLKLPWTLSSPNEIPHALASHSILLNYLINEESFEKDIAETYAVILGGHHGTSPETHKLNELKSWNNNTGFNDDKWLSIQNELVEYAISESGIEFELIKEEELSIPAQAVLTGLVIMTDWIASDDNLFPYIYPGFPRQVPSDEIALDAWSVLNLPISWTAENVWDLSFVDELFLKRFEVPENASLRPIQESLVKALNTNNAPGIVVIEAPMGEGKTEAALMAAEIMATYTGRGGVFLALPTQATTDGLFSRIRKWVDNLDGNKYSMFLAHGKAKFNTEYRSMANISQHLNLYNDEENDGGDQNAVANDWLQGRKKGILSDFVVGTIDQVLMGALRQRHLALRHLALANKVVIIDECHAYDAYMSQYLEMVLQWLGAYNVPVIVLSATLPSQRRKAVVDAYLNQNSTPSQEGTPWKDKGIATSKPEDPDWVKNRAYPLITYTNASETIQIEVAPSNRATQIHIEFSNADLLEIVTNNINEEGCIAIIQNTVARAQQAAQIMIDYYGNENVMLLHSQFLSNDRIKRETELRNQLGPSGNRPHLLIVVGTQVLEQSLDVDFDLMITDIAPIDLLLQRMGRLHRHDNPRPSKLQTAKCIITGIDASGDIPEFEKGSEIIYGRYLLLGTTAELADKTVIDIPKDIPLLVQNVYAENGTNVPDSWKNTYADAKTEHERRLNDKKNRAKVFRLRNVYDSDSLIDWLNTPAVKTEAQGEATVRDSGDSLEVIVVQHFQEGSVHLLPWIESSKGSIRGREIPTDTMPDPYLAGLVASCTVHLPNIMCAPWMIDHVIADLEKDALPYVGAWQNSYWLKGALVLMLDENFEAVVNKKKLKYNRFLGLSIEREE